MFFWYKKDTYNEILFSKLTFYTLKFFVQSGTKGYLYLSKFTNKFSKSSLYLFESTTCEWVVRKYLSNLQQEILGYKSLTNDLAYADLLFFECDEYVEIKYIGSDLPETLQECLDFLDAYRVINKGKTHGDAAYWNFRSYKGKTYLIDWEEYGDFNDESFDYFRCIYTYSELKRIEPEMAVNILYEEFISRSMDLDKFSAKQ